MVYSLAIFCILSQITALYGNRLSDKRLCADAECTIPISEARTMLTYGSDHPNLLSFRAGEMAVIYSKSAGTRGDLWGAEINGKRGYIPKGLVRETRVYQKQLKHIVSTEYSTGEKQSEKSNVSDGVPNSINSDTSKPLVSQLTDDENVKSDREHHIIQDATPVSTESLGPLPGSKPSLESVTKPFEVVDGTTLYIDPNTTDPLQATKTFNEIKPTDTGGNYLHVSSATPFQRKLNSVNSSEESEEIFDSDVNISKQLEPEARNEQAGHKEDNKASVEDQDDENSEEMEDDDMEDEDEDLEDDEDVQVEESEIKDTEHQETLQQKMEMQKGGIENGDKQNEIENGKIKHQTIGVFDNSAGKEGSEAVDEISVPYKNDANDVQQNRELNDAILESQSISDKSANMNKVHTLSLQPELPKTDNFKQLVDEPQTLQNSEDQTEQTSESDIFSASDTDASNIPSYPSKVEDLKGVRETDPHADPFTLEIRNQNPEVSSINTEIKLQPEYNIENSINDNEETALPAEKNAATLTHDQSNFEEIIRSKDSSEVLTNSGTSFMNPSQNFSDESMEPINDKESVPGKVDHISEVSGNSEEMENISLYGDDINDLYKHSSEADDSNENEDSILEDDATEGVTKVSEEENLINQDNVDTEYSDELITSKQADEEQNRNKNFFSSFSETIISGFSSVSQLALGSSDNIKQEENLIESASVDDVKTGEQRKVMDAAWSSLWRNKPALQESAEHVATDPDQTGHKVDVEILSTNDYHDTSVSSSICEVGIDCTGQSGEAPNEPQQLQDNPTLQESGKIKVEDESSAEMVLDIANSSPYLLLTAVVTTCVLLVTIITTHFLQRPRYVHLTANILKLEKQLMLSNTDNAALKEQLDKREQELNVIHTSSSDTNKDMAFMTTELERAQAARSELEEQVASLEKELEAATEAGLELNRMLSDFLSTQHGSETLVKSVEHLQKQLDSQQHTISEMNTNLTMKTQENENLQQELKTATEKLSFYEEELSKTTDALVNIQKEKIDLMSEMENKIKALQLQLSETTESTHVQIARLTSELEEARETVAMRASELTVLQDCLRQLKALEEGQGSDRLDALLDVGHARAELALITMERDALKDRLRDEEDARRLLEDHAEVIKEEVENLRSKFEEAEKEKLESQTRLEVLSNYFKEKETQLQRELGLQEAMYIQKEGDASNTHERIKSLQEEIENYKSQNEMLKKEIIDQERSLKGQLATLEKKAHENWVAARQAERKLEESRQEAGHLRNRLTVVEKNITNSTQNNGEPMKAEDRLSAADSNGELPTSFLHLGMQEMQDSSLLYHQHRDRDGHPASPPLIPGQPLPPFVGMGIPPPGVFMPPPPLPGVPFGPPPPPPLFPGDRRPPPLGRMSSPPPPPRRYSPDPHGGFSPYDRTPPLSPHDYDDEDSPPDSFRHRSPPPHLPLGPPYPPPPRQPPPPRWDDPHSSFRPPPPAHRDSPRESKGSALSSGHSSESLDKSSRHSGRV